MANAQQRRILPAATPSPSARFTVGRDRSGRWIVHDRDGLVGGFFINEAAALHFAAGECNCPSADIHRAAEGLALEFTPFARGNAKIH
ncbi:hypothetical protein [Rhizobium binae]|uniref:Uncharacterized protein n=1 Tax=Rhizobium binae TaxID=1138190 RepID=A0ABV2MU76_9HYPH|nr:hypothetical protein [Rhizobium binae]NKL51875.1 hypothetical protein [Rhizobium leguminosarum bv. viciae]MBX4928613.1 hypothetical protein [Rhizobium binae]MBX4936953.1 hypothetical protein [Rhizobium binae]MBX4943278.1 hypothetical protein [Rhizobium binae]MBX4951792.1 hypothetical protein [Rhizobium binae]